MESGKVKDHIGINDEAPCRRPIARTKNNLDSDIESKLHVGMNLRFKERTGNFAELNTRSEVCKSKTDSMKSCSDLIDPHFATGFHLLCSLFVVKVPYQSECIETPKKTCYTEKDKFPCPVIILATSVRANTKR